MVSSSFTVCKAISTSIMASSTGAAAAAMPVETWMPVMTLDAMPAETWMPK